MTMAQSMMMTPERKRSGTKQSPVLAAVTGRGQNTSAHLLAHMLTRLTGLPVGLRTTGMAAVGAKKVPLPLGETWRRGTDRLLRQVEECGAGGAVLVLPEDACRRGETSDLNFRLGVITSGTPQLVRQCETPVLNLDDPALRPFQSPRATTLSERRNEADVTARNLAVRRGRLEFEAVTPEDIGRVSLPLNSCGVYSALTALACGRSLGYSLHQMTEALYHGCAIPGHMEQLDAGGKFSLYLDGADSPEKLEDLLWRGRKLCQRRLIAVVELPGESDMRIRPMLGQLVSRMADVVVLSAVDSDQGPAACMLSQTRTGMDKRCRCLTETDWETGFRRGLELAQPGDLVVVASPDAACWQSHRDTAARWRKEQEKNR